MAEGAETIDAKADQRTSSAAGPPAALVRLASPVQAEMLQVEQILRDELSPGEPWMVDLYCGVESLGGKRIRPLMSLLFARATGDPNRLHCEAAAAFELVHLATLVHDDVLDEADLRRGQPTLHRERGDRAAILCGDSLFTLAFAVASRCGNPQVVSELARSSNRVCSGEIRQNYSAGDWELGFDDYTAIVSAKTASLCAGACRCGVLLNGGGEALGDAAWRFGNHLGIAFQVIDDCLDLDGSEALVGKTLGTDLAGGKLTWPLIHCLRERPGLVTLLQEYRRSEDARTLTAICGLLVEHGSLDAARVFAMEQIDAAIRIAGELPESPARQSLVDLARFVGTRNS